MAEMIDVLRQLIGVPPAGLEFLEYVFALVVLCFMFYALLKIISIFISFIKP